MKRRLFIAFGAAFVAGTAIAGRQYPWIARRVLIRLRLSSPPANLLRNAGFLESTNAGIPDYWGSPNAASLVDVNEIIQVEQGSPIRGARSVQFQNSRTDFELILQSYGAFVPESQPYTFSVYLKSDAESHRAALSIGWSQNEPITVTGQWQRYKMTYTPVGEHDLRRAMPVFLRLRQKGTLWVAGPQLEMGVEPTPFSLALMDDHPLVSLPWGGTDQQTIFAPEVPNAPAAAIVGQSEHPARTIGVDPGRRCLIKDGKPFLMSAIAVSDPNDRQLDDIAVHGFDAVSIFVSVADNEGDADAILKHALAQFDAALTHGLGVVVFLELKKSAPFERLRNDAIRAVKGLKHHSAIVCWMILDEPQKWWEFEGRTESQISDLYLAAKDADPSRPVFINHNSWGRGTGCYGGLDSTDIGCVDLYPIGQYQNPLKPVADLSQSMNVDCIEAHKPSAFWHQLYGYDDAVREPTPEEERAMTYLSIIHGTRLLFYWLYKPLGSALWESMKSLREELNKLEFILLDDESRWLCVGTSALRVHYSMFRLRGAYYLIACNASPERVRAVFEIERLAPIRPAEAARYFEGSAFDLANGKLSMTFAPYERQVFEFR